MFWTAFYLAFCEFFLGADLTRDEAASDVANGAPRMKLGFAVVLLILGVLGQITSFAGGVGEPNAAIRFLPFAWLASIFTVAVLAAAQDFGAVGRYAYGFLSPQVVVMSVSSSSSSSSSCCCGSRTSGRCWESLRACTDRGCLRHASPISDPSREQHWWLGTGCRH